QAEDGIRDPLVTGVQTCALPISFSVGDSVNSETVVLLAALRLDARAVGQQYHRLAIHAVANAESVGLAADYYSFDLHLLPVRNKLGIASCGGGMVVAVSVGVVD